MSHVHPKAIAASTLYTQHVIIGGESGGATVADQIVTSQHTAVLYSTYGDRESFAAVLEIF